ncbi:MAG: virginiamycin lyase, partial [Frankiaceae bacterium]|nr:virginiamycin lyase [Frankiaceae bacterium]
TPAGAIAEFSSGLTSGADLKGIATGSDGAVWFAEHIGAIGRMTVGPAAGATIVHALGETTADLRGDVSDNGAAATYAFDWGTTTAYGQQAPATSVGVGNSHKADATLTGLQPGTTYHARVVVTTATGRARGSDVVFTTGSPAPVTPVADLTVQPRAQDPVAGPGEAVTPGSPAAPEPLPALGSSVVGGVASGTVLVRDPGGKTWKMGKGDRVKNGSVIDARNGRVRIVSALDAKGHTQAASFWGGVFAVRQSRGSHGMVDIHLQGTAQGCAHGVARSAKRRPPVKLWGKDRGGRYRTFGSSSVATVRGTEWLVMETCAGTVTRVVEGSVSVWDRGLHKRVLLAAKPRGAAYLARR